MKVDVSQKGEIVILRCNGSLDADSIPVFKKHAYDALDNGKIKFVLDASNMEFVDSMGLGVLISFLRKVKEKDGDVKIAGLTADVKTIFEITRLYRLFDVSDNLGGAVKNFKNEK